MIEKSTIIDLHKKYCECSGVSIDTRSIQPHEMFFALKGPNFDGHLYLDKAFEAGAKYAVIEDEKYLSGSSTILVTNVEKALQDLARYFRSLITIPVIGLTGSNGKTTTKELIASVLSENFEVFATKGNLNNHLGVPLSILSIKPTDEIAIIEMGANHQKEIKFLSEISMPDYGLITNIGKAHLEGFGSIEGVRKAKTELYDYLRKVDGTIFYNCKDEYLVKSITSSDKLINYDPSEMEIQSEFPYIKISYQNQVYRTGLSGGYNAINMLAAITVGTHFQITEEQIVNGLSNYSSSNNRSEIKDTINNRLILDAYNANPSSMRASIENLRNAKVDKKILIIGHMLELGSTSKTEHDELVQFINKSEWEMVLLIGSEFEKINIPDHFFWFKETSQAKEYLTKSAIKHCTILLKGSRGIALEKLIPIL